MNKNIRRSIVIRHLVQRLTAPSAPVRSDGPLAEPPYHDRLADQTH